MCRACVVLLVAIAISGCRDRLEIVFFSRSAWKEDIACIKKGALIDRSEITDLVPIGDSAYAALFADDRTVVTFDRSGTVRHTLHYDEAGPRGVRRAVSAAVSDSIIYVADEGGNAIKKFDRHGNDRGTITVPFIPRRLRLNESHLLVTPLVAGNRPAELLFVVDGKQVRAVGAPIAQYEDVAINTLANMASLITFPGRAVLMHELVVPFGYVFDLEDSRTFQTRFAVPLAAETKGTVRDLPKPPLNDKNVNQLTVVAFVAAARTAGERTYYVTRIGDGRHKPYRKLLVELDSVMRLGAVYPIDVNPHHMVFVDQPAAVIGVDAESNWFECRLP